MRLGRTGAGISIVQYVEPTPVLFSGAVRSGCGTAESAMGPFHCPSDQKVYIDMSFYDDLSSRFGAPGDFAQAYVVAHEVGHHPQNLLGTSAKVHNAQQRVQWFHTGLEAGSLEACDTFSAREL